MCRKKDLARQGANWGHKTKGVCVCVCVNGAIMLLMVLNLCIMYECFTHRVQVMIIFLT